MTAPPKPRIGVLSGGNWIVDHVKIIDSWPPQDALANILSESAANGGSPYNILKNLAILGADFPLAGVGLVGYDADGETILADCRAHGIDAKQLRRTSEAATSYTDVMTERATGRRTFFHQRGANALLAPEHFDFSNCRAKIFHLGYLLLLDSLDQLENGRPRACETLHQARAAGLLTSLDCVSENSDRFRAVALPVLPEVDFLFANDFEAEKITGTPLRSDANGPLARSKVEQTAQALIDLGVRAWVLLHFPEGAYALSSHGESHWQPSLDLPPETIKGSAGAGDAFASGALYGLHEDWPIADSLRLGVCAAASSLTEATCSGGLLPIKECEALAATYPWRELPVC